RLRAIDTTLGHLGRRIATHKANVEACGVALAAAQTELETTQQERAALTEERAQVAAAQVVTTPAEREKLLLETVGKLKAAAGSIPPPEATVPTEGGGEAAARSAAPTAPAGPGDAVGKEPAAVADDSGHADAPARAEAEVIDGLGAEETEAAPEPAMAERVVGAGGPARAPPRLGREQLRTAIAAARPEAGERRGVLQRSPLVAVFPKPAGGWRPIGLLSGIPRLQGKLRQPAARRREAGLQRSGAGSFWGGPGRSAHESASRQALAAEAANAMGMKGAALLLALGKAPHIHSCSAYAAEHVLGACWREARTP
ncbi:unnamed protein product, partial [Prorocentrum cordatum]